jgi:hypothetical protein
VNVEGKRAAGVAAVPAFKLTLSLAAALALFAPSCSVALHAQTAATAAASAGASGDVDSKSIFGMWMIHLPPGPKRPNYSNTDLARGPLSMTPYGIEKFSEVKSTFGPHSVSISESNEPTFKCFPPGVPAVYTFLYPVEIVQAPNEVIMLYEYDHQVRHVYTDGRPHPTDAQPTWMGHSTGHPHSEQLHLTERLQRVDKDFLRIDFTFDDPKTYTQPWTSQLYFQHKTGWEMLEYLCTDNLKFLNFEKVLNQPASK